MHPHARDEVYHTEFTQWLEVSVCLFAFMPVTASMVSCRPANRTWHWVTTDDLGNHPDIINVPDSAFRYVSRTLYRGYYLIGWRCCGNTVFKTTEPATPKVKCLIWSVVDFLRFFFLSMDPLYCWKLVARSRSASVSTTEWNLALCCGLSFYW